MLCADGSIIDNIILERLRHSKKHTTAFVGSITNEKRQDDAAVTTQRMLNTKQVEHLLHQVDSRQLFAWLGHSDNVSHFKCGLNDELLFVEKDR